MPALPYCPFCSKLKFTVDIAGVWCLRRENLDPVYSVAIIGHCNQRRRHNRTVRHMEFANQQTFHRLSEGAS